jgi:hypothetical protein
VEITLELTRATDFIVFHAKNLTITSLSLFTIIQPTADSTGTAGPRGKKIYANERDMVLVPKLEQVFVQTAAPINSKGNVTLIVGFEGQISDRLEGMYMSEYHGNDGHIRYITILIAS